MFLATIEIGTSNHTPYEMIHNIITDFKDVFNLRIIDIQNNKELEYHFMKNNIEEDEAIYGLSHIIVSFKFIENLSLIVVKLENKIEIFHRCVLMYEKLEEISGQYFKK